MKNIKFDHCYFHHLHQAFYLGNPSVTTSETLRTTVANSTFDLIYAQAIYSNKASTVSALNTFLDVGNNFQGTAATTGIISAVITFVQENCTSFGDYFSRNDTAAALYTRVDQSGAASFTAIPNKDTQSGHYHVAPGKSATLADNTTAGSTGITFDPTLVPGGFIEYVMVRGANVRTGCIVFSQASGGAAIYDTVYLNPSLTGSPASGILAHAPGVDSASDIGVTFSATLSGGVTTIKYTTTNTGTAATMKYNIRYFT